MTEIIIVQRMWQRRGTAAEWAAQNPVLAAGEIGVELGANAAAPQRFKIGNGTTAWLTLAWAGGGGGGGTWYTGTAAPSAALGQDGDSYLRTGAAGTGDVYTKSSGAWAVTGNIRGPAGVNGSTTHFGAGAPPPALGANGDTYLRTSNSDYYLKSGGTWGIVANLRGLQGLQGDPGPAGPPGPSTGTFPTASFSGGAGAIEVGSSAALYVPFGFTVTGCTLIADRVGTLQVDVRLASFSDYPPSSLDSICGGTPPTLSNSDRTQVTDLALWTTDVPSGSVLQFICTASVGIRQATMVLTGFRS